jgi:hypothetical protein
MPATGVTARAVYDYPFAITTTGASLPEAITGEPYTATLTATGRSGVITWNVASGDLPPGLTLSTAGILSGTPTAAGTYTFTVAATAGATTVTKTFTLTVIFSVSNDNAAASHALTLHAWTYNGELHIKGYDPSYGNLYLFDAAGRLVAVYPPPTFADTHTVNITHFPVGVYYLKTAGKTFKIIKK